jgi:predicted glycosyltransferase
MKILIDIGHPAHVHLFRPFALEMQKKGHAVLFTCRQKEFEIELLKAAGFTFNCFGKHYKTIYGKIWGLLKFNFQMLLTGLKFNPDVYMSHGSLYAAQIAWLLRKPHISFEDTYNFEQIKLYKPFTKAILVGDYEHPSLGKNEISYKGYHESLYLHPNTFKPSEKVLDSLGVKPDEKYVILRFVSWTATHDIGSKGFTLENKIAAVKEFSKYAKVFISSEKSLPAELESYKIPIAPEQMHDAIAFSSMIFGESATMVSEGAMLGVPGFFINNAKILYLKEQEEKYGLVFNYTESIEDQLKSIEKGIEILSQEGVSKIWQQKRSSLLNDKIDATAFVVWFVENYPESYRIMKENPDYQLKFK